MGSMQQGEVALALPFPLSTASPLGEDVWDEELSFTASSAVGLLGPRQPGLKELKTKPVTAISPTSGRLVLPNIFP